MFYTLCACEPSMVDFNFVSVAQRYKKWSKTQFALNGK